LKWQARVGDKFDWFVSLQNQGIVVPILDQMPEVEEDARPYLKAFHFLSGSRRTGFGPSYIPLTEIIAYCDLILLTDPDTRFLYAQIIQELDAYYLTEIATEKSSAGKRRS